ncbi:MAG: Multiheme cytochrome [Candidatus Methanohalarchaeum thermophilum]|uniref:Multiheme cytochrome n=1 Tax=Methanohalarchaeum thermophilum TaxID=1903181 RepID=A0A1Q6DTJ8_METT1|nr:MAG: Multiheme cytochrome [Candidatus Methanohalarchaeum thermophilum]
MNKKELTLILTISLMLIASSTLIAQPKDTENELNVEKLEVRSSTFFDDIKNLFEKYFSFIDKPRKEELDSLHHPQFGDINCRECHPNPGPVHDLAREDEADCVECHQKSNLEAHSEFHLEDCYQCHDGGAVGVHKREEVTNCSKCHQSNNYTIVHSSHSTSKSCSRCHSESNIQNLTNEQCNECHGNEEAVKLIKQEGDAHKNLECIACHDTEEKHAYMPNCQECHGNKHGNNLARCYDCHRGAHNPKPAQLTNQDCITCHSEESKNLEEKGMAHSEINCVECHTAIHTGYSPSCQSCHQSAHTDRFPRCYTCHQGGHNPWLGTR